MKIIGLTGGIASGKSTVSGMLKRLGAQIIDADMISREIVKPKGQVLEELVRRFGNSILDKDGALNRRRLGCIVFNDREGLKALNGIMHPRIKEEIARRIAELKKREDVPAVVIDAPLLIECGMVDMVDQVWLVYVDRGTQIARLTGRDDISVSEALNRIDSQMPTEYKKAVSDVLIDNSGDIGTTEKRVNECWANLVGCLGR